MSTKADTWMPFYVADYLRDTMHLTTEQHGAYMLLLMACWTRGGSLPADDAQLAGMAKMTPAAWRKAAPLILPFFARDGVSLTQKRVTEEFEKAQRMAETRRQNGQKGGRPKKLDETGEKPGGLARGNLDETPTRVALPSPSPSPPETSEDKSSASPDLFADPDRTAWLSATYLLTEQGGLTEAGARKFFGKLLSDHKLQARDLLPAASQGAVNGTRDPRSYLSKAATGIGKRRVPPVGAADAEWC